METFLMVISVWLRIHICADRDIAERDAEVPVLAIRERLCSPAEPCVPVPLLSGSCLANALPTEYVFNTEAHPFPIINPSRHANF